MDGARNKVSNALHTNRTWLREFFAEFLGTAFLVALGDGAVAQMKIRATGGFTDFLSVNLGYAFAIAFGVYICGGVSGGHINPAVSLTMCLFGRLSWIKLPIYWLAQYFGAFIGSVILYVTYIDTIGKLETPPGSLPGASPGHAEVINAAGIFATFPGDQMTVFPAFLDQVVGSAVLLMCVFALTDPRNAGVPKYFVPLLVGLVVGMIGMCYGIQCGFAINPARDFAPRLFTMLVYGGRPFWTGNNNFDYFFWIPILGPHLGAILGALIYQGLVGIHWPPVYEVNPAVVTVTPGVTTTTVHIQKAPVPPVDTEVRLATDGGKNGKDTL